MRARVLSPLLAAGVAARLLSCHCEAERAPRSNAEPALAPASPTALSLGAESESAASVSPPAHSGPRCRSTDPACEPLSTRATANIVRYGYDPQAPRRPSAGARGLSADATSPACGHDGDCVSGGCGNHCVHWAQPEFMADCALRPAIFDHYCGCLEARCQWFTQPMAHLEWASKGVQVTPPQPFKHWPASFALEKDLGMNLGPDERFNCLRPHAASLPQVLRFVLRTDSTGQVTLAKVTGGTDPIRQCLQASLRASSILGGRQSFEEPITPATIRGSIEIWLKQSD